ncbi:MAG: shikimate dehydrogenase [Myxococcota bacterium]|nr:shikimate dehydrogenase [Myxococcota bacterium]
MPPKIAYALVGDPIDQSPSPAMHNAAFAELNMNAEYRLRPTKPEDKELLLAEIRHGKWAGLNITTPLKTEFLDAVELREHAAKAGAVNTLWRYGSEIHGALTDIDGIIKPLEELGYAGESSALIIGAGGAARAAAVALDSIGATINVVARNPDKARDFLDSIKPQFPGRTATLSDKKIVSDIMSSSKLIIQATPVGSNGEEHDLDWSKVQSGTIAFDMIYQPIETPFLKEAVRADCQIIEGWKMLLEQGVAALKIWTGRQPPRETMREALLKEIRS